MIIILITTNAPKIINIFEGKNLKGIKPPEVAISKLQLFLTFSPMCTF